MNKPFSTKYNNAFYLDQQSASLRAAKEILPLVLAVIPSDSLLDVGCGVGTWLITASELGVRRTFGVDGDYVNRRLLLVPEGNFRGDDLSEPFNLCEKFDLVLSLEVAEHIPEQSADLFIDNLTRHGGAVLFSAAIPGQGGTGHVNEQWPDYWKEKFAARGYTQFDWIRKLIWDRDEIPFWYRQNIYLYLERSSIPQYCALPIALVSNAPTAWIHPLLIKKIANRPLSAVAALRALLEALWRGFTVRLKQVAVRVKITDSEAN